MTLDGNGFKVQAIQPDECPFAIGDFLAVYDDPTRPEKYTLQRVTHVYPNGGVDAGPIRWYHWIGFGFRCIKHWCKLCIQWWRQEN
jgi:hypothetical protein